MHYSPLDCICLSPSPSLAPLRGGMRDSGSHRPGSGGREVVNGPVP